MSVNTRVTLAAYAKWRRSTLGALTEHLEQENIFSLAGDAGGLKVLDVGCGDGVYSVRASREGADVVGLDHSRSMLEAARARAASAGAVVTWCQGDAMALPFRDASVDMVLAVTALCLISEPLAALNEMNRVLRPGGVLVVGELGRWSLWALRRRLRGWLGDRFWRTAHFWTAAELRRILTHAGLRVSRVRGAVYYPPSAALAKLMSGMEKSMFHLGEVGAAFIAVRAIKEK
jgi:ubiquinone/menaquinone biosynthesis C-methylase UbiE